MRITLKRGNDQVVTVTGLKNTDSGEYMNTAVVKATLRDSKGAVVPAFQNVVLLYITDTNGNYEWSIEGAHVMPLAKSTDYLLEVTARQDGLDYRVIHQVTVAD